MSEFERALGMCPEFGLLRRLGTIAPLLGVTLTAGSVLWGGGLGLSNADNPSLGGGGEGSFILGTVGPLFWGVFIGAFLAIVNQVLVSIAHREEARILGEAEARMQAKWFRDTEERLDAIVSGMERGGVVLNDASEAIVQMLTLARKSMEGMAEACNEAATDLKSLSMQLEGAIKEPVRDFVESAKELRGAAVDAAREFQGGVKTLAKQAANMDKQLAESIARQEAAVAAHGRLVGTIENVVKSFEATVEPLHGRQLQEFTAQLQGGSAAIVEITSSMLKLEKGIKIVEEELGTAVSVVVSRLEERVDAKLGEAAKQSEDSLNSIRELTAVASGALRKAMELQSETHTATASLTSLLGSARGLVPQIEATRTSLAAWQGDVGSVRQLLAVELEKLNRPVSELASVLQTADLASVARDLHQAAQLLGQIRASIEASQDRRR